MIRSFGDNGRTLFPMTSVCASRGIRRPAKRKLEALDAASRLEDLMVLRQTDSKVEGRFERFLFNSHQQPMEGIFKWIDRELTSPDS